MIHEHEHDEMHTRGHGVHLFRTNVARVCVAGSTALYGQRGEARVRVAISVG